MRLIFFLPLFIPALLQAQPEFSRDTSYTIHSTWMKLQNDFPFITPVTAYSSAGIRLQRNIIYATHSKRNLHLDIFRPQDEEMCPAIVMIHGGGWRSGDKEMEHAMAAYLAARGYVAVPVEYRLSGEAAYPAALYDLKAAVRWLRVHAGEYHIDDEKIAVYGSSAGGTLAALMGVTGDMAEFEQQRNNAGISTSVQAIVDVDGILDFTHPAESGKDTGSAPLSAAAAFLGATYRERPELWREASPVNHVSDKTPPVLCVNSSVERFHAGRDEMIEKLSTFGIYSEVHTITGTPHSFWLFHPWFEETASHIVRFLDNILKGND